MQNFMRFHFLLHKKPLHAIPEGINICSFTCQALSSSPLLKKTLYQFLLFSNFFLIHDIKIPTQPPYSANSNTFHGVKIDPCTPSHLSTSSLKYTTFFLSSSHNGSGTKVFSNVGQFIKTLLIFAKFLFYYIYTLNHWFLQIK